MTAIAALQTRVSSVSFPQRAHASSRCLPRTPARRTTTMGALPPESVHDVSKLKPPASARQRTALVEKLIAGAAPEELSQQSGVPAPDLKKWRARAKRAATQALDFEGQANNIAPRKIAEGFEIVFLASCIGYLAGVAATPAVLQGLKDQATLDSVRDFLPVYVPQASAVFSAMAGCLLNKQIGIWHW